MNIVFDIETDGLDPTTIHCVVTRHLHQKHNEPSQLWRDPSLFNVFAQNVTKWIGHSALDFDVPVLNRLWGSNIDPAKVVDTLVLSRLNDVRREGGHSLDSWGKFFNVHKIDHSDWSTFSPEMEERCRVDVVITQKLYVYLKQSLKGQEKAVDLEHKIANLCIDMHNNGFKFNHDQANLLMRLLEIDIEQLDKVIFDSFPPEIIQKGKKEKVIPFNPNSSKQIIDRIAPYWKPIDKTPGHIAALKVKDHPKKEHFVKYGWKINERNFATLVDSAPAGCFCLVKRLIYETRRRKLQEWLECLKDDGRIHGNFIGLGTWTHRLVHTNPNQANVAAEKSIKYKTPEFNAIATSLGAEMRKLFIADGYLVGVDAEGIQLRILAHYLDDPAFTEALVQGNKDDGTDVHSLNKKVLGLPNVTRDDAKTFIYAYCLGAGPPKIASILHTDKATAAEATARFENSYAGLKRLRDKQISADAKQGYFVGLDGRRVLCDSPHHMLAGYLQNGEAVVMKTALVLAVEKLEEHEGWKLINFVHDELIFEVQDYKIVKEVQAIVEEAIGETTHILNLKCPMKGKGSTGINWLEVH